MHNHEIGVLDSLVHSYLPSSLSLFILFFINIQGVGVASPSQAPRIAAPRYDTHTLIIIDCILCGRVVCGLILKSGFGLAVYFSAITTFFAFKPAKQSLKPAF